MRRLARLLPLLLLAALLAVPASAGARSTPRAHAPRAAVALGDKRPPKARISDAACPNADLAPARGNLDVIRAAILCLHNQIRARYGLPALKANGRLRGAAVAHSSDMVQAGYFDHTTPRGTTMVDRILGSRYVRRDQGWTIGENLAWGTGALATPAGVMQAWMASPGHRANILKRAYREVGIGVVLGVPSDHAVGATYTADFGVVRR